MTVVNRAKKKVLVPTNIRLSSVNIDVVENGYHVQVHVQYEQAKDETRHDERQFVFDNWGDVCDFLKKVNELVKTFKVTKYAY
jgi:hypothetical protein